MLAAACPSAEASALGLPDGRRPPVRRWPPVEVVRPGPAGRASRLVRALGDRRAEGSSSRRSPGSGVAQVCRSCGEPAACAVVRRAAPRRRRERSRASSAGPRGAAGPAGRAPSGSGAAARRTWRSGRDGRPRSRSGGSATASPHGCPARTEILVGGPDDVRDLGTGRPGPRGDPRRGSGRSAGRGSRLASGASRPGWRRSAGRARAAGRSCRRRLPGDPIVQALVRGNPDRFHADERERRHEAGLPGRRRGLPRHGRRRTWRRSSERSSPRRCSSPPSEGRTVCLLALDPERVRALGMRLRELAADGVVDRVEAEPHL